MIGLDPDSVVSTCLLWDLDDVIVYGTNIYQLYLDINREYEGAVSETQY